MFSNFGWGEIAVILVLGLFVFGPDRLPRVISDGVRMVRQLRAQATSITSDLRDELDLDGLRGLDPRAAVGDVDLGLDEEPLRRGSRAVPPAPAGSARLAAGEVPPYDPDAT